MAAVRCPTIVGRRAELTALRSSLAAARLARGSTVVLSGRPGIGKSRLAREAAAAARAWQVPVLVGRAVEAGAGTAFRPLAEALLGGLRRRPEPDDPALAPFRPALGRLVPQWRDAEPADDSLVVLGEAVLRLLAALAADTGLLLVIEDLHWSDAETLAVLEYVADNLAGERVLLVVTTRDDPGPASALVRSLAARGAATVHRLGPLDADEVAEMARACRADVGADLAAVLDGRAGGVPLFVEELLAAEDPGSHVPDGLADLLAGRVATLPAPARRCLDAAAVLGERFDWRLLPAVTALPDADVAAALRAAVGAGIVETTRDDGFRFHHALGRDAVLAAMLPPDRAELARRALTAVEAAHPGLEGTWCDVAADLALRGGDTARAAAVLVEAGRRNLARGALGSAESVLGRARELAGEDSTEIDELLSRTLVLAGKTATAVVVTTRMIDRLRADGAAAARVATAELRLAEAHTTAGDWAAAEQHLDRARQLTPDPELRLQIAATGARVALDDSRFDDARRLAHEALDGAAAAPDVRCVALTVLGRIARRDDPAAAEELFTRARRTAEAAGLPVAAARAAEELAIGDVQESLRVDRLSEARARAAALGDVGVVAVLDLQAAAIHNSRWEAEAAVAAAERCIAASRRFRLATLPKGLVLGAVAHDYLADRATSDAWLDEALALAPDDTHLRGEVSGARAYRAIAAADDTRALALLDEAMTSFAARPNEVTGSPVVGCWLLVRTALDPARPPGPPDPITNRWNRGLARFADAVVLGRAGNARAAVAAFDDADAILREPVPVGWFRLQARRIVAGAALADGWGDPAVWAAQDLPVLEARGLDRSAAALRGIMRRAGVAVPRRGRGDAEVPRPLRALGVTSRETDVLLLVAEGCGNREIAERLFLSPRTVEKHVERLLAKTGSQRRAELVAAATRLLGA
ncbi:ATP-binding protein [Pseudonocardia dioxanivorans]|uniref:ATP-binding protein n=1 Tax=Pseudonocardia dioxanivorans TaxID=240495 RepID=UPI000CD0FB7F|nr:LuxR family transcriptional regulator [Pseudonocardia dioxanivorans]